LLAGVALLGAKNNNNLSCVGVVARANEAAGDEIFLDG